MATWSASDVLQEIGQQAGDFGLDPRVAGSLFMAENSGTGRATVGNGDAVSTVKGQPGAVGVMQVMPGTARGLQKVGLLPPDWKHDPNDLASQVQAGLAAIKDMSSRVKNPDDPLELAAYYNGGTNGLRAYQSGDLSKLPTETRKYLDKFQVAANNLGLKVNTMAPTSTQTAPAAGGNGSNIQTLDGVTGDFGPQVDYGSPDGTGTTGAATSTGTRTSVRKPLFDTAALSDFTTSLSTASNSVLDAAKTVVAGGDMRQQLMETLTSAIKAHGEAEGQEANADAVAAATQAARRAGILTATNLNPDLTNNLMLQTARTVDSTSAAMAAMKPEIDERMAVGMFDNPFQWLVNQTILPGLVQKYNSIVGTQNAAVNQFSTMQNIASTEQSIADRMDADIALQRGVAIQKKVAAKATQDLTTAQINASVQTERSAMNLAALASENVNLKATGLRITKEQETDTTINNEKQSKEQLQQQTLDEVNRIQRQIGGNQYKTYQQFALEPKLKQEQILSAARSGKFGDNLGDSFRLIQDHGDWNTIAGSGGGAAVQGWAKKTIEAANTAKTTELAAMKTADPKEWNKITTNPEASKQYLMQKLNQQEALYSDQAENNMRGAADGNPFKIQYMQVAKDPSLVNNPLAIYLRQYGPGGTEPRTSKVDEGFLMDRFAFSVATGKMPMPDAVKAITDFYKTGSQITTQLTTPYLFGMDKPDKTYAVKLADFTGNSKSVTDLGNPVDVEAALTRIVARRAIAAQQGASMFSGVDATRMPLR